jgi:imidazolonepropionase-like amidohydrolase
VSKRPCELTQYGAAEHIFMEDMIGSIEVRKYVDLVVWDKDLYSVPSKEL